MHRPKQTEGHHDQQRTHNVSESLVNVKSRHREADEAPPDPCRVGRSGEDDRGPHTEPPVDRLASREAESDAAPPRDRDLLEHEIAAVVAKFSPFVRKRIRRELERAPITPFVHRAQQIAIHLHPDARVAEAGPVRRGIFDSGIIEDLQQDLWVAFVAAVRRGAVRAADPVIAAWIKTAARFVVRGKMATTVVALACTGSAATDAEPDEAHPKQPRSLVRGDQPDVTFIDPVAFLAALRSREPDLLTEREWYVALEAAGGASDEAIAAGLQTTSGNVRTLRARGRRRLREALAPANDNGTPPAPARPKEA